MAEATKVKIPALQRARIKVTIVGTTPLLTSRIPDDALVKQKKKDESKTGGIEEGQTPKEDASKTPEEIYLESRYMIDETTHGFPGRALTKAMIGACRLLPDKGLKMTEATLMFQAFTPDHHEYYKLKFKKVSHSKMFGRNKAKQALIEVHRAMYEGWSIDAVVDFDNGCLKTQDAINLVSLAGAVGLGAFRPEKGGPYGQFVVKAGKGKSG